MRPPQLEMAQERVEEIILKNLKSKKRASALFFEI